MVPIIRLRIFARRWISRRGFAFAHQDEPVSRNLPPAPQQTARIKVIALTLSGRDHQALAKIAENNDWELVFVNTWSGLVHRAKDHRTGVVLIDRGFLGSDWREAVWPLLQPEQRCCVILIGSSNSDHLCEEFMEQGGYGALKSPLQDTEVVNTVRRAWVFWKNCIARAYGY